MKTIGLLACAKDKQSGQHKAGDLYQSPLFSLGKTYLERHCDAWFILSAKHGLLHPDRVIESYDITLNTFTTSQRKEWAAMVWKDLESVVKAQPIQVVILAGRKYREHLERMLVNSGSQILVPMAGLGIGQQLAWLKKQISTADCKEVYT